MKTCKLQEVRVRFIGFDLWGNLKDGIDWNDSHGIGSAYITCSDSQFEKRLLAETRKAFAGRYLARTENLSLPMTARGITIGRDGGSSASVQYLGIQVGYVELPPHL